jgi:hypothetical protein
MGALRFAMTRHGRNFPAPWTSEWPDTCFIIRDHNGKR